MTSAQEAPERPRTALGGWSGRLEGPVGALPLMLLFAVASAVLVRYALQVHTWQPDEVIYVFQGRSLADHFPGALWDTRIFNYGIERLNPLYGALTTALFSQTATALQVHKALIAISFASVTIPIYLLARGVGLSRAWALCAATLAVAVPWAPLATSFLNDPVAYPGFAWAAYGSWRAATFPGWRSDLIGLACVALAGLARSNLAVLGAALVIAILATELRYGRRGGWRQTGRRILRDHVPVAIAVALGVLYLIVKGKSGLTGTYPVDFTPAIGHLLDQSGAFLGFVAQGLVLIPVIVASAWALRHLVRPLDRERFALAVVAIAATAALLYSLLNGVREERYVFEVAPLMTLLMVVAVARRDVPPLLVAGTAILVALLVNARDPAPAISGSYIPFAYPGQGWFQSVIRGRAAVYLPDRLAVHLDDILIIGIPLLVIAAMFLVWRGRRVGFAAGVALVALQLAIGVGAAGWALHKYVTEAGDPHGASFKARSWVDQALGGNGEVGAIYAEPSPTADGIVADTRFWNRRFKQLVTPVDELAKSVDPETGRFVQPIPENILIAQGVRQRVGIAGKPLAASPYAPVQLWRITPQSRAAWLVAPASVDGWMPGPRSTVIVRTWDSCVHVTFTAPPDQPATLSWSAPGERPRRIVVATAGPYVLKTTQPGRAVLTAQSRGTLPPNVKVAGQASTVVAAPCAS